MDRRAYVLKSEKYTVVRELGRGGMGVVYLAEDKTLQREVALKVLYEHLNRQSTFAQRFQEEARSVSTLHHPNIVYINGLAQTDSEVAIDMEYVEGLSLRELADSSRITPHVAVAIARDVLNGLVMCHSIGIVHRDIKPSNILINGMGTAKLTDFGLATAYASHLEETVRSDTSSGFYMGTPRYMPAEAWEGAPPKPSWDLYSFGLVLYELLSGELVFPGTNPMEIVRKQVRNPVPDLSTLEGKVSPDLIDVVEVMLRATTDGSQSCDSASVLAALESTPECSDLCESNNTATVALPPIKIRRSKLTRWARKNRPWFVRAAGALLVVLTFSLALFLQKNDTGTEPADPEPKNDPVITSASDIPPDAREVYVHAQLIDEQRKVSPGQCRIALDEHGTPTWIMGFTGAGFWSLDVGAPQEDNCWAVTGHWGRYVSTHAGRVQHGVITGTLIWKPDGDTISIPMVYSSTVDKSTSQENLLIWLDNANRDGYEFMRQMEADAGIQGLLYSHLLRRNLPWAQRVEALLPSISGGRLHVPKGEDDITVDGELKEAVWGDKFLDEWGRVGLVPSQRPAAGPNLSVRWSEDSLLLGATANKVVEKSQIELVFAPGIGSISDSEHKFSLTLDPDGNSRPRYFFDQRQFPWETFWETSEGEHWEVQVAKLEKTTQFEARIPLGSLRKAFPVSIGTRWRINARWTQENSDGTREVVAHWGDDKLLDLTHGILLIFEGKSR